MAFEILRTGARFIVLEISDGGKYNTLSKYEYEIVPEGNGIIPRPQTIKASTDRCINLVTGLYPDMNYKIRITGDGEDFCTCFHTLFESATLDVRQFGAVGDGIHDDTMAIQTAINVCPENGRILLQKGRYAVTAIFIKGHINIEIEDGAELIGTKDKSKLPILPGIVRSYDENCEYNFASWEGNPLRQYASMITGFDASDCIIYGHGTLNGNAGFDDWWNIDKEHFTVARPNMFFVNNCSNIMLAGVLVKNSPCWTLHPYFSKNMLMVCAELVVIIPNENPSSCRCRTRSGMPSNAFTSPARSTDFFLKNRINPGICQNLTPDIFMSSRADLSLLAAKSICW